MKPQQLAKLLDVAPTTIRRWAREEYREFLSPMGQGMNGGHRSFNDQDARIIGWIAHMRAQNMPPSDITATLRSAQAENWHGLPDLAGVANGETVAMIPREAVEERVRALEDRFKLERESFERERHELRTQIADLKAEAKQERQRAEDVTSRLIEMSKELAVLNRLYAEFIMRQSPKE